MNDKRLVLDNFEHGNIGKYETMHRFVSSYDLSMREKEARVGTKNLQLTYDFSGWTSGNGAMYIKFTDKLKTYKRPKKLSLWVDGDGNSPWLRATLIDGAGERKIINLTDGSIDWHGWKYVDVALDSEWPLPLQLEQIYLVETDKRLQGDASQKGHVGFDQLCFVYVDDVDLIGPTFTNITPQGDSVYRDTFTFSAYIHDDMSGVDPASIRVFVNNEATLYHYDKQTGALSFTIEQAGEGRLCIEVQAADFAGNRALPPICKTLEVDLSPDHDPPIISDLTPGQGITVTTPEPRITFNIHDEKSGVQATDIVVLLNQRRLDVVYDEKTGWCYSLPNTPLVSGVHQLTVYATDRSGNVSPTFEQTFKVGEWVQEDTREDMRMAVIPDTHTATYARFIFDRVARDSTDVVLHMGDMVEQAEVEEFENMQTILKRLQPKPVLALAGNHESFQDNLDLFLSYVGLPTFHLKWSHTLIVVLNTAYEQSISASDSTQFHYLQQLLRQNTKANIIIATHVPTHDRFGTSHQMDAADARMLEKILGDYKHDHPSKRIMVLFGHVHVLDHWEKNQVDYIITGNAARKSYVAHDKGNLFGYGVLNATPNTLSYEFKPCLTKLTLQLTEGEEPIKQMKCHATYALTVLGHIHELDLDYTVDITDTTLIQKKWTSSDTTILTVEPTGVVHTHKPGMASVKVVINGSEASLQLTVV